MKIPDAHTKFLGLFGWPVEHSLSPRMHNSAFEELGLNYCYLAIPVEPGALGDAVRGIRAMGIRGVNVTVPHKEKVIAFLDELDEEARFIGAVNTIVNTNGKLKGYNTDGRGFIKSLEEEKITIQGINILVLGAGGASRAISYYLCQKAKKLSIFDIDGEKLRILVDDLQKISKNVSALNEIKSLEDVDILINATPLGLKDTEPYPVEINLLRPGMVAGDLIYRDTPFQKKARELGMKTFSGLGMLLWQGVLASELWTGVRPPHETMRRALMSGISK